MEDLDGLTRGFSPLRHSKGPPAALGALFCPFHEGPRPLFLFWSSYLVHKVDGYLASHVRNGASAAPLQIEACSNSPSNLSLKLCDNPPLVISERASVSNAKSPKSESFQASSAHLHAFKPTSSSSLFNRHLLRH
jgi:hypothetical protein